VPSHEARDKVADADVSSALHEAAAYGDVTGTASRAAFGAEVLSDRPADRLAPARGSGPGDPHGSSDPGRRRGELGAGRGRGDAAHLLFLLPYFLLAMLIRRVLVKTHARGELPFRRWWYVSVGAFAGMTLVCIFLLSTMLPDYEALTMVVFMWPLTFPIMLVLTVGGVLAGGMLGWLAWRIRSRT
jgi:hypothetical protein